MATSPERTVPCPSCAKQAVFAERNPWRPFCSEFCRGVDLGAWASERFRVPAEPPSQGDDDGTPPYGH